MTDVDAALVGDPPSMSEPNSWTINVQRGRLGDWQVALPDEHGLLSCETLVDAKRAAYLLAADRQPCQLVFRDAYHRVVGRELIEA
jgi:hypothetical protein